MSTTIRWRRPAPVLALLSLVPGATATVTTAPAPGAPAARPPAVALTNGSLERDVDDDGQPDCFEPGGFGTSEATFERVRSAHTGAWAERVRVRSLVDGDRKLVAAMVPGCAPATGPGRRHTVSVWYTSTVPATVVVYAHHPDGWRYWTGGPTEPPAGRYRRAELALPPVPPGVDRLSFGLAILSDGELVTDDYALATEAGPDTGAGAGAGAGGGSGPEANPVAKAAPARRSPRPSDCRAGRVALTFDDGPDAPTARLLDVLAAEGAPATFFVIGEKLGPVTAPLVRRAVAEGHVIGDHTWTHPHLRALTDAEIRAELARTAERLVALGVPEPRLWRPPFEDVDARVTAIAADLGLRVVLWDLDTLDWRGITPAETARRVVAGARAGSVVLMHDRLAGTVDAVPAIVAGLRARGLCPGRLRPADRVDPLTRSAATVEP